MSQLSDAVDHAVAEASDAISRVEAVADLVASAVAVLKSNPDAADVLAQIGKLTAAEDALVARSDAAVQKITDSLA